MEVQLKSIHQIKTKIQIINKNNYYNINKNNKNNNNNKQVQ